MANQLRNYSGKELLVLTGGSPLGNVGISEIDDDLDLAGDHSKMNVARSNFNSWASELSMNLDDLTAAQFSALELALKYYALYLYQEWDLILRNKSECSENDYRRKANLQTQCAITLKQIGSKGTEFIAKFEGAINAETTVGPLPYDVTDLIRPGIVTDNHCANETDDLTSVFGDYKMTIDEQ